MGEWSDYFEDFPEENPANWINGRCDPQGAAQARELKAKQDAGLAAAQTKLDAEIKRIVEKHRPATKQP